MSCPRCGSNDLWDDNLWWGCNSCGYAGSDDGGTMCFAKKVEGLPNTVKEVNERAGWDNYSYGIKLIKVRKDHE